MEASHLANAIEAAGYPANVIKAAGDRPATIDKAITKTPAKRGRPRKNAPSTIPTSEPPAKRRRGRPRKTPAPRPDPIPEPPSDTLPSPEQGAAPPEAAIRSSYTPPPAERIENTEGAVASSRVEGDEA
jgi:hypothetical protein